jgi:cell division protein FtsB
MNLPRASRSLEHFLHAHALAPWRAQRRWIGVVLVAVLGLAMTAALYLDITSQAAIAGRQIQVLRTQITSTELVNADLKSQVAESTSAEVMQERARQLGYEPVEQADLQYLPVPGYSEPEPVILASAGALIPSAAYAPPEYTESLFAWLGRYISQSADAELGAR